MPELKGKAGIRKFLLDHVGEIVETKQVMKASGNQVQYSRRLRELRDEDGWEIQSHLDTPALRPGQYRLLRAPRRPARPVFSRKISKALRAQALEKNGFTCQRCGAGVGDKDDSGRRVRLHVHHILPKSAGGEDKLSNLQTLCMQCNQGAKNITEAPPGRLRVLAVLRKANRDDQRHAYEWLKRKLGME